MLYARYLMIYLMICNVCKYLCKLMCCAKSLAKITTMTTAKMDNKVTGLVICSKHKSIKITLVKLVC